jgi:hypothetical protein
MVASTFTAHASAACSSTCITHGFTAPTFTAPTFTAPTFTAPTFASTHGYTTHTSVLNKRIFVLFF